MLKTIAKFATMAWLVSGLVACDNADKKQPAEPQPTPEPTVTQTVPPTPKPEEKPAPLPGLHVSLQQGNITFELPPGFSDQTPNSGFINDSKSHTQLFLDSKVRQRTVTSEVVPPQGMKLDNSDKMRKELMQSMMLELGERYQNIKKTKEENFTVGKQTFRRLDSEQQVNGQKVVSTLILTVFNKRVITLQMLSPAKTPDVHQALVQRIIDKLAVK